MGSENYPLRNIGIYRNLPTFDPSIRNLTALITGANGISGFNTMRALLDSPERWTKIYALSRRPPPEPMMKLLTPSQRARVEHIAIDFLSSSPQEIAKTLLASITTPVTHVFFYSYVQPPPPPGQPIWSNADDLVRINTALLSNFLTALPLASIHPRRIALQTGAKNYGVHLGRARQPAEEQDPQPSHLAPNFYYPQETALFEYSTAHSVPWTVIMPAWVVGAVSTAAMSAMHPFAVYSAVQSRTDSPIIFPADWSAWSVPLNHSTARLTGYLTEWAALEPKCENQRFNSTDTKPFTFDRFYGHLATWFGVAGGVVPPSSDPNFKYPIELTGAEVKDTPLGYGPPMVHRAKFSFVQWAKEPGNRKVWEEMMERSGGRLTHNPFEDPEAHFSCGDMAWAGGILSMDKARRLGWTGWVDTMESVREMYVEMATLGMVPEMVG